MPLDLKRAIRDPWVWGQFAWFVVVAAGAPAAAARLEVGAVRHLRWGGMALLVAGGALAVAAVVTLGKSLTPATRPLPAGEFVAHGPYRVVRHPIYLAVILALTGYAALFGNGLVAAATGTVSFAYFSAKASVEEHHLLRRFREYKEYQRRTSKLIPRW